jgi:hypothetical protein
MTRGSLPRRLGSRVQGALNRGPSLPTAEAWKQGTAETLGAPIDGIAWMLHKMGLPISGDKFYGGVSTPE